jgi:hypothetical protein
VCCSPVCLEDEVDPMVVYSGRPRKDCPSVAKAPLRAVRHKFERDLFFGKGTNKYCFVQSHVTLLRFK